MGINYGRLARFIGFCCCLLAAPSLTFAMSRSATNSVSGYVSNVTSGSVVGGPRSFSVDEYISYLNKESGLPSTYAAKATVGATAAEVAGLGTKFMRASTPVGVLITAAMLAHDLIDTTDPASGQPAIMQKPARASCDAGYLMRISGSGENVYTCFGDSLVPGCLYLSHLSLPASSGWHDISCTQTDLYHVTSYAALNSNPVSPQGTYLATQVANSGQQTVDMVPLPADPAVVQSVFDGLAQPIAQEAIENDTADPEWPEPARQMQALADSVAGTSTPPVDPTQDPRNQTQPQTAADQWPSFCSWASVVCDAIDWMKQAPAPPADTPTLPVTDATQSVSFDSGLGSGSCPADRTTSFMGKTITYSFATPCEVAGWISYVVLALATLTAGFILAGIRQSGG